MMCFLFASSLENQPPKNNFQQKLPTNLPPKQPGVSYFGGFAQHVPLAVL